MVDTIIFVNEVHIQLLKQASMYKIILIFSFMSFQVLAQTTLPPELDSPAERADRLTKEMIVKIELHSSQIEIVDSLNYAYAVKMQAEVFDKNLSTWRQYRTGNKIMTSKDEELKDIFSVIQYKKYEKLKSEVLWEILGRIF